MAYNLASGCKLPNEPNYCNAVTGNPHFIVVRGLDEYGQLNIADPGFGNRTMSVAEFENVWTDGIGFVVTR
jgi:predicted double-glycine peptidase